MASDKIKRSFLWMRKSLGIIEKTTLPGEVLGEVRPTMDLFGWERLVDLQVERINAAAPAVSIASNVLPDGVTRYIHSCSLTHTDTGVNHEASLIKRRNPSAFNVGIPTDRTTISTLQQCSMIGRTFIKGNEFIIGQVLVPPVAGVITLTFYFVDIDEGEYIPPM